MELPDQIAGIQARDARILRTAPTVGIVTAGAGGDAASRIAGSDHTRHGGMILRVPVGGRLVVGAPDLAAGEKGPGAGQGEQRAVGPLRHPPLLPGRYTAGPGG